MLRAKRGCVSMPDLPSRLPTIDFLRGIAILLVLGRHHPISTDTGDGWNYLAVAWHHWGWTGVDLFFVLSGFLIGGLLFKEYLTSGSIQVGRFLKRRGFKIWPSYYIYLAALTGIMYYDGRQDIGQSILPSILNVQNYFEPVRIHLWSLGVEEHFYLALPILLWALIASGLLHSLPAIVLGLAVVCTAGRVWFRLQDANSVMPIYATHLRIDALAIGVLLAYVKYLRPAVWIVLEGKRIGLLISGAILVAIGGAFNLDTVRSVALGMPALYLGYAGIIIAFMSSVQMSLVSRIIQSALGRWVAWAGMYSFSIYLWHNELGVRTIHRLEPWISATLGGVAIWPIATACYVLAAVLAGAAIGGIIEYPVLKLRDLWVPAIETPVVAMHLQMDHDKPKARAASA